MIDTNRICSRLQTLISIKSISGTQAEFEIAETLKIWLQALPGVEVDSWRETIKVIETDPCYQGHQLFRTELPVVVARLVGKHQGPKFLLTGHFDITPLTELQTSNSETLFNPEVKGDKVTGAGAANMKSGLVAAIEVFEQFSSLNGEFSGELLLIAVPAGEDGGLGTLAAIRRGYTADFAILLKPTGSMTAELDPSIVVAHAGYVSFSVTIIGKAINAAKKLEGENALDYFMQIYSTLKKAEHEFNQKEAHPLMKELVIPYPTNISNIHGGNSSNTVIDKIQFDVKFAVALGETTNLAKERFKKIIHEVEAENMWLTEHPPTIESKGPNCGSASIETSHQLITSLMSASEFITGRPAKLSSVAYACDMAQWKHILGIPICIYGPGDLRVANTLEENVSLNEIKLVTEVILNCVANLLKAKLNISNKQKDKIIEQSDNESILEQPKQTGWFKSIWFDLTKI
eukprot:TRINITY_DN6123_c1_g1_i1.p1 TRINITY_DN6123_c1_g1~~TRINITY_DN6123_c1_g1_i1.p1  ORF type:complete len:461 (-),score=229.27 TRINITY_DN6123_c1_g1_i1:146-1528(-)